MAGTLLQLPPEQGGLQFGPFAGLVQIGSDNRRCQIVLDASQGIYPMHATLAEAPGGAYHFAPTEMGAKCFVVQQGSPQIWPVTAAVQVNPGDQIIVGTPGGPRFTVIRSAGVVSSGAPSGGLLSGLMGSAAPRGRRGDNLAQGIADEFARRGRSRLLTQSPFREIYIFYNRYRSGALFNPVYIVGSLLAVLGMLGTGTVTCTGLVVTYLRQLGIL